MIQLDLFSIDVCGAEIVAPAMVGFDAHCG
jgi:hypothetical protein